MKKVGYDAIEHVGGDDAPSAYPHIRAAALKGIIWYDTKESQWIGRASDGVEVSLGGGSSLDSYLALNPTPDKW